MGTPIPDHSYGASAEQHHGSSQSCVVLPANWWEVAAANGQDPQEVDFQRITYGWTVGERVQWVPPAELRLLDASMSIQLGDTAIIAGLLLALAQGNSAQPKNQQKHEQV